MPLHAIAGTSLATVDLSYTSMRRLIYRQAGPRLRELRFQMLTCTLYSFLICRILFSSFFRYRKWQSLLFNVKESIDAIVNALGDLVLFLHSYTQHREIEDYRSDSLHHLASYDTFRAFIAPAARSDYSQHTWSASSTVLHQEWYLGIGCMRCNLENCSQQRRRPLRVFSGFQVWERVVSIRPRNAYEQWPYVRFLPFR